MHQSKHHSGAALQYSESIQQRMTASIFHESGPKKSEGNSKNEAKVTKPHLCVTVASVPLAQSCNHITSNLLKLTTITEASER